MIRREHQGNIEVARGFGKTVVLFFEISRDQARHRRLLCDAFILDGFEGPDINAAIVKNALYQVLAGINLLGAHGQLRRGSGFAIFGNTFLRNSRRCSGV